MNAPIEQWVLALFALSSIVFIGVVIWALLEIRRIMTEAQQTLTAVKGHLVLLIQEMRETTEQADGLVRDIREAFQRTSTIWYALGDVGRTIERVQDFTREATNRVSRWFGAILGTGTWGFNGNGKSSSMYRETEFTKRRSADD